MKNSQVITQIDLPLHIQSNQTHTDNITSQPTMWPRFLTLLLFVSCAQAISSSDFHRNFISEQTSVNPSFKRDIMRTEEPVEKYGIIKDALRLDTKVEENYKLSYDSRTQRGRGVYGGANVNHGHRRSQASLLPKISTVSVSLALMLLFLLLQLS